ncbi:methylated-DNA--[protein]-cysteine S-methyltransferase [Acidobacteria bacterium AB60]|nr:methylated-DNA--[protein]-cysteine S-methyltransferase [Acidobacteria bacterium AB60]
MSLVYKLIDSPVGKLKLIASEEGLVAIFWGREKPSHAEVQLGAMRPDDGNRTLTEAERQLEEYFAGKRREFSLRLDIRGTPFQKNVWEALLGIPYGETTSYGEIAKRIGKPSASRAVGAANGQNPIPIVVPCHRVIGSTGKLTGFGGGLDVKEKLLGLESPNEPKQLRFSIK